MATSKKKNLKLLALRQWILFVNACVDDFLGRYLSSKDRLNEFVDDPVKGFLSPDAREKTRDPDFNTADLTDDDYIGFINDDQYSQIDMKINRMYGGTGTATAKKLLSTAKALMGTGDNKFGLFHWLIEGMLVDGLDFYLPKAGDGACWPDNKSAELTRKDVELIISMMWTSNRYRDYAVTKTSTPERKYTFDAPDGYGLYCAGYAEWYEDPTQIAWNSSGWRFKPLMTSIYAGNDYKYATSMKAAASFLTSVFEVERHRVPSDAEWKNAYGGIGAVISERLICNSGQEPTAEKLFSGFVSRVARNFPEKLKRRVYPLIDGINTSLHEAESIDRGFQALTGLNPDDFPGAFTEQNPSDASASDFAGFLKPFDLQCFLLENINYLASIKDSAPPYQYMGRILSAERGAGPGNLVSYLNLGGEGGVPFVKALLELCPDIYALLVPYIRLYRIDYEQSNKLTPKKEIPIPFGNYLQPSDIDLMTQGKAGRAPGAGIKSFSWNLDGVQPEDVENNISAELVLYFQTVQDIFSLNKDNLGRHRAGIPDQAGYLDLIIGSSTSFREQPVSPQTPLPKGASVCEVGTEAYEGENFRIKAVAGWSVSDKISLDTFPGMNEKIQTPWGSYKKSQILKMALDELKTVLYLQITTHELAFQEDGSVELTANYQASISGILNSPSADVFAGDTIHQAKLEELKEEGERLKQKRKEEDEVLSAASNDAGQGGDIAGGQGDSQTTKDLEANAAELASIEEKDKMAKYKRFLCGLYESGKIYGLKINAETYRQGLLKDMTAQQRAQVAKTRTSGDPAVRGFGSPQLTNAFDTSMLTAMGQVASKKRPAKPTAGDEAAPGPDGSTAKDEGGLTEEDLDSMADIAASAVLEEYDDGSVLVPYFYLGDLIDNVLARLSHLSAAKDSTKHGSMQLLLASVELMDPLLAMQVKSLDIDCANPGAKNIIRMINEVDPLRFAGNSVSHLTFAMNLGSLPVSLNYFQQWFMQNVISPQRDSFSLMQFLKSVCANLITKCFNALCFKDALNYSLKFDIASFDFGSSYVNRDIHASELAKDIATTRGFKRSALREDQDPMCPALIFYSVGSRPLTGDYQEDLDGGIYHYFLGSACGLAKNIKFNKVDMPYYREARISRKGALGAEQLRELYTVELDMVGNTLHKNGQYIYIEPIGVGIGSIKAVSNIPNLARMLGIGGYHLVTGVSHTITDGGFDVHVKALQEGLDFSQNKIVSVNTHSGEAIVRPNYRNKG